MEGETKLAERITTVRLVRESSEVKNQVIVGEKGPLWAKSQKPNCSLKNGLWKKTKKFTSKKQN